jgi:hypothetical protein
MKGDQVQSLLIGHPNAVQGSFCRLFGDVFLGLNGRTWMKSAALEKKMEGMSRDI